MVTAECDLLGVMICWSVLVSEPAHSTRLLVLFLGQSPMAVYVIASHIPVGGPRPYSALK